MLPLPTKGSFKIETIADGVAIITHSKQGKLQSALSYACDKDAEK